MQPPNPEPPKSSGIKFTKFTWKRTQKDDANGKEPPKTQKTEDEEKPKLQMKLKTTSTQLRNIGKVRTGLSSKVPNFAPHTRVISKPQFRGTQQPQHNPGNNVSVSTFLAASKKSIPAVPPSAPMEKPEPPKEPPPPTPKPPSIITKIENKEPPPPGTEEIENDGAESDASGISMELASDED
uniref:Uncharacterized protein n=1 Tax=Ciona savignyi TaxID=51511 RepID=H2YZR6_CIOSA